MRYIVFAFDQWYPVGGADDIQLVTDDRDVAFEKLRELKDPERRERIWDHIQIYDTIAEEIIA